ncbi:MAG: aspartate aminotransferase family protein [Chloroflexota bacterium]
MSVLDEFLARTPGSRELFERATHVMPGGSTRTATFAPPYPLHLVEGRGLTVRDVDGNTYRDFLGNYTSLILGHAHPAVVAAVEAQVRRGSAFAASTENLIELAEEICRRVPSIERVRFANSGTEATMFAVRAARAATGRSLIAIFDGAYHGTHDAVLPGSPGVPEAVSDLVLRLPWNDPEGVERTLKGHETDLAAIIIEPVQGAGGVRAADPGFLRFLRELADRTGSLLIFDEIICFRLGYGGVQGLVGVRPDLTALGKIIGGGYPIGAFGGRADVMDRFDARRPGALSHSGTFNGNPVSAAAGLATLRELTPAVFDRLDALGSRLGAAVRQSIERMSLDARINTMGSLFQVWSGNSAESANATGASTPQDLFLGLLLEGFAIAPRGMGAIPTVASETDMDELARAITSVLASTGRPMAVAAGI